MLITMKLKPFVTYIHVVYIQVVKEVALFQGAWLDNVISVDIPIFRKMIINYIHGVNSNVI